MLRNAFYLFATRIINAGAILGLTLLISRNLGPAGFGAYAFLNAVIMTCSVIANWGLEPILVREVSRAPKHGSQYLSASIGVKLIASLVVVAGLWCLSSWVLPNRNLLPILRIYSLMIALYTANQCFWYYGDAFGRFQLHSALWAFSNILKVPLVWLSLLWNVSLEAVIFALVISEMISLAVGVSTVSYFFSWSLRDFSFRFAWMLIKRALPVAAVFILNAAYFRTGLIMLELMTSEESVGLYSSAFKLIEFIGVIPSTICVAMLPGLSAEFLQNRARFRSGVLKAILFICIFAICLSIGLWFGARGVIFLLYGDAYQDAVPILRVLSAMVLFYFCNTFMGYVAIASDNERMVLGILIWAAAIHVGLNFWLIPLHAGPGAAFGALVAELLMFGAYLRKRSAIMA